MRKPQSRCRRYSQFGWLVALSLAATTGIESQGPATAKPAATTVTTERLRNPPAAEWLTYGLDHAETRFSKLTRIDTNTVRNLKPAWTWDIPGGPGQIEATPIVHDGVLYASGTWSTIFALDARTGDALWHVNLGGTVASGPMTYLAGGRQYVAVSADTALYVFALPE